MSIPSQAELLAEVNQLKTYRDLYRNGYLPDEVVAAAMMRSSVASGGSTSDASANNQLTEIERLTQIRDRFTLAGDRLKVDTKSVDTEASGTISALNAFVAMTGAKGESSWALQVTGTFVGTLQVQISLNGTDFIPVAYRQTQTGSLGNRITRPGIYRGNLGGIKFFRVIAIAWTSGSASVNLQAGHTGAVFSNTIQETRELAQYYSTGAGGRVSFNFTSGLITVGAANMMILALVNPANSPIDLYIERITLSNSANGVWTRLRDATVTPTGSSLVFQNRGGGDNLAESKAYTSATATISGGSSTSSTHVGAYLPSSIEEDGALILRPGQNSVFSFNPVSLGGGATASVNLVLWESVLTV